MEKMENNGENSGPLTSLPVDRLTATDCNADHSCQKLVTKKTRGKVKNRMFGWKFSKVLERLEMCQDWNETSSQGSRLCLDQGGNF